MTTAEADFESLSVEESADRLSRALARLDEERFRPTVKQTRPRHACSEKTKRKLSKTVFARRRAEALLDRPSAVARLRLAAGLTMRRAADKALVNERTWHRAESDFDGVSPITQRRIAHALGVAPDALR